MRPRSMPRKSSRWRNIVQRIVTTLNLEFTLVHQGWQFARHTDNPEAYDDTLRGIEYLETPKKGGDLKARQMCEKAVALAPKYSTSYMDVGATYWLDWVLQWSDDPSALDQALQLERQAIALDDSQPMAHTLLSGIYVFKKQYDQASAEAERTLALDPNSAGGYEALARIMDSTGKSAEAIGLAEKAMRLDPRNREIYLFYEGWSYSQMGRNEEGISILRRHLTRFPNNSSAHALLVVDYTRLGREADARVEGAEILRISPQCSWDVGSQRSRRAPVQRGGGRRLPGDLRPRGRTADYVDLFLVRRRKPFLLRDRREAQAPDRHRTQADAQYRRKPASGPKRRPLRRGMGVSRLRARAWRGECRRGPQGIHARAAQPARQIPAVPVDGAGVRAQSDSANRCHPRPRMGPALHTPPPRLILPTLLTVPTP